MPSKRLLCLPLVVVFAVAGCGTPEENTPGCQAGNRSQCVMQLALGDHFGCARLHDRTVWCWGQNDESQLGYATSDVCPTTLDNGQTQSVACHTFAFQVAGLANADTLAAGGKFACALRLDGTVACWGANAVGQLGRGDVQGSQSPVEVKGITGATSISLGARHACAVVAGAVLCWGANDTLQLGIAHATQSCGGIPCETSPKPVDGVKDVAHVAAGARHTCALGNDWSIRCWGANDFGQLGTGMAAETPSSTPRPVGAAHLMKYVSEIVAGDDHTCTVREDGAVICWGKNDRGQLGIASPMPQPAHCAGPCSPTPLLVATLPNAPPPWPGNEGSSVDGGVAPPDMSSAPPDLAMAPHTDDGGPLEAHDLAVVDLSALPVPPALTPPRHLAAGANHTCAQLEGGTLRCWGSDKEGQLGDGKRSDSPSLPVIPIAHPGAAADNPLGGVTRIATGAATSCARIANGSLRCWGSNLLGALGEGDLSLQDGPVPLVW